MTLREEIAKSRADARNEVWKDMTDVEINMIIERIDKIEDRVAELEFSQPAEE